MKDSLFTLVQSLLFKNKISLNKEELKFQIASHPSYPSLHAITGVLDHFGIENMALDIPQNNEVYEQLPKYFIAQIKNNDGQHLIFVNKQNETILISYPDKKKEKLTKTDFLNKWTGIVVVVDEDESELKLTINKKYTKYIPIIILIGIINSLIFINVTFSYFNFIHLAFSAIGVYIGVLLVKHELGIHSETVEKLCTQTKKTSCNAVLNSKGATLFGLLKLSDIALVYFTGLTFAWLLFLNTNSTVFNSIATLSILAFPVVLYSIYYQAVVVKKWCPLCLATATVLLCQALLSLYINPFNFSFKLNGFLILSFSLLSLSVLYSYIKLLLISKLKLSKTKVEYYKFKRNFSLFNSLYSNKPFLDTKINNLNEIVFGNSNAKLEIVVITNPLCGFCKATHQAIEKLLKTEDLKVIIRFNINTDNSDDIPYKIATALLNIYQKDKIACSEAMHQIYTDGVNVEKWLATYNKYTNGTQHKILETEKQWCLANNIYFTPAVYLNDKEYPKEYDLSDLNFFMEDLVDEKNEVTEMENVIKNTNVNLKHNVIPTE